MELVSDPANARVQRTFAFIDVCGFTRLIDRRGDDAAVRALVAFRSRVRQACGHYGVRAAKWLGDGVMLVGVEADRLSCAAFEIVAETPAGEPRVRGGLAAGEVLVFEGDDYIGRTVNLAARLCDHAKPGQLLAAASVAGALPPTLQLRPSPPLAVAGFRTPVDVGTIRLATPLRRAT